jgi:hypothetical protein
MPQCTPTQHNNKKERKKEGKKERKKERRQVLRLPQNF